MPELAGVLEALYYTADRKLAQTHTCTHTQIKSELHSISKTESKAATSHMISTSDSLLNTEDTSNMNKITQKEGNV